jgi:hypothetical protein
MAALIACGALKGDSEYLWFLIDLSLSNQTGSGVASRFFLHEDIDKTPDSGEFLSGRVIINESSCHLTVGPSALKKERRPLKGLVQFTYTES